MARNIILFVALAALAAVGYVAFLNYVTTVTSEPADMEGGNLPPNQGGNENAAVLRLGGSVPVQQGGQMEVIRYDPQTGQARDRFAFATWTPLGTQDKEVRVEKPELSLRVGGGRVLTIIAAEGQITVDRPEQVQSSPKRGVLRGGVRILLDQGIELVQVKPEVDTPQRVTIELEELRFDLQVGTLASDGALRVLSPEFEVSGRGLFLEWNQADNLVKQLVLRHGDRLTLRSGGDVLRAWDAPSVPATQPSAAATATTSPSAGRLELDDRRRSQTTYELLLTQNVRASQLRGGQRVGGLRADSIKLVVDVGGQGQNLFSPRAESAAAGSSPAATSAPGDGVAASAPTKAPASAPSSPAASAPSETTELVVQWDGPLTLRPLTESRVVAKPRRHFSAVGGRILIEQGTARVECDRLEYFDETQQVWLYADGPEAVRMHRGAQAAVHAQSVYIDQKARVVKLVGDVSLRSYDASGAERNASIRAAQWAELHLRNDAPPAVVQGRPQAGPATAPGSATASAPVAAAFELNRLESARFVGDVRVRLQRDELFAEQLDVRFRTEGAPGAPLESLFESADASGAVRYSSGQEALRCDRLAMAFSATDDGRAYPSAIEASGAASVRRGPTWISGRRIRATLEPVASPTTQPSASVDVAMRELQILEKARLEDPENRISARGDRIVAQFEGRSEARHAMIYGSTDRFAELRVDNYRVRGGQIDMDPRAQVLAVNGRAWLAFDAARAMGAAQRRHARLVEVTAERSLRVDAGNDRIEFAGNVTARSGSEALMSDALTLMLRSIPQAQTGAARTGDGPVFRGWLGLAQTAQRIWAGARAAEPTGDDDSDRPTRVSSATRLGRTLAPLRSRGGVARRLPGLQLSLGPSARDFRKEPLRLVADNALFRSESVSPNGKPVSIAEVGSPKLDFEIPNRTLVSTGLTVMLMSSYAMKPDAPASPGEDALGLASPLISRGPSQTGIKCEKSMTYAIGQDSGGQRRDGVVLDGSVHFFHATGQEMLKIADVLPDLAPAELARLPSRKTDLKCERVECEFLAAAADPLDPRGSLKLAWLIATGTVNLRDEQTPVVRTVYCDRLEFNREQSVVTINGSAAAPARVFVENTQTNRLTQPVTGESITLDLKNNEIRTPGARGEFRR